LRNIFKQKKISARVRPNPAKRPMNNYTLQLSSMIMSSLYFVTSRYLI